jgi:AAA domain-containing protein
LADTPKSIEPPKEVPKGISVTPKITPPKLLTSEEITAGLLALPSLLETSDDEVEHVILYGQSGKGKTTLAGLLSEFFNVLWLDGDKGMTALLNNLPPELIKRIHPIKIPDNTANPILAGTILRLITGRQTWVCREHGAALCPSCVSASKEKTTIALNLLPKNWVVVLDSQTQFVSSAMALTYYKIRPSDLGKDTDEFWRPEAGEGFAFWGGLRNISEKYGNYVKDLKCQYVAISHDLDIKEGKGENERVVGKVPVAGSENASVNFARYFGTEVYAKIVNHKHTFITSSTYSTLEQTKSRANVKLEEKKVPSLLHVFRPKEAEELLKGSYTEWFFGDRKLPAPQPKGVLPE